MNSIELKDKLSALIKIHGDCPVVIAEYGSYDTYPITSIEAIKQEYVPEGCTSMFPVGNSILLH